MTIEQRVAQLEQEMAELKRQLEERPVSEKQFNGTEKVIAIFLDGYQRNLESLKQLLQSAGGQSASTQPEKSE